MSDTLDNGHNGQGAYSVDTIEDKEKSSSVIDG